MFIKTWYRALKSYWCLNKRTENDMLFNTSLDPNEHAAWWGSFTVAEEQSRYSKIDQLVLCIDHSHQEWRITQHIEGTKTPSKTKILSTHILNNEVKLRPSLPDRALLSSFDHPLFLPSKGTVMVYAIAPVWVRVEVGSPCLFYDEISTQTLTDTWWGGNTVEGELCYAGKPVYSRLDDWEQMTSQAIIPISIMNYSPDSLSLKELRIPLPFLSIYADTQHHLWTEQLNIFFKSNHSPETLIAKGPPARMKTLTFISEPRTSTPSRFKNLFKFWRKS